MSDQKPNQVTPMIASIIRSLSIAGAIVGVTLPLSLALGGAVNTAVNQSITSLEPTELETIEKDLSKDCFRWFGSKKDSGVEKDAESKIDKYMGGVVNYEQVCDWVLN